MDMKAKDNRERIVIQDARLGKHVELVEPTILEVLKMNTERDAQPEEERIPVILAVIALCLHVDGAQYTSEEVAGFGARRMRSVMALGGQALEMAGFSSPADVEEDGGPKG